jgi:sulfite reductase (NADPH) flavoprotein alpha-component
LPRHDTPSAEFPLLLTTGRVPGQWHLRTKTGNVPALNKIDSAPYLQMQPDDAAALGLSNGDCVSIQSRQGQAHSELRITSIVSVGVVFMPMHWANLWSPGASPNEAIGSSARDPMSSEPAMKYCAVRVTRGETSFNDVSA